MFVPADMLRLARTSSEVATGRAVRLHFAATTIEPRSAHIVPKASPLASSPQDNHSRDPKREGPVPEYPQPTIDAPGSIDDMNPRADHGEHSYVGLGRLENRVALITGGDSGI